MSVTYGFYNSINHDRKYDAKQISQLFDGLILDGVYRSVGKALAVSVNSGMYINVAEGRAWFNHTWTLNDSTLVLVVPSAHPVYSRIDAVIIKVDVKNRTNSIEIKSGVPASSPSKPTMSNGPDVYEHPLAYITLAPEASTISPGNINQRIGSSECPFVTGVVQGVSIDTLIQNWKDEFDILFAQLKKQTSQAVAGTLIDKSVTFEKLSDDAVRLKFQNVTVPTSAWATAGSDTDHPYRAAVPLTDVTSSMFAFVAIGRAARTNYDFSVETETYNGGVYIFCDSIPKENVVLDTVVCLR